MNNNKCDIPSTASPQGSGIKLIAWYHGAFPWGTTCLAELTLVLGAWGGLKKNGYKTKDFCDSCVWVSICALLPTIKWICIDSWFGGKSVKYLNLDKQYIRPFAMSLIMTIHVFSFFLTNRIWEDNRKITKTVWKIRQKHVKCLKDFLDELAILIYTMKFYLK